MREANRGFIFRGIHKTISAVFIASGGTFMIPIAHHLNRGHRGRLFHSRITLPNVCLRLVMVMVRWKRHRELISRHIRAGRRCTSVGLSKRVCRANPSASSFFPKRINLPEESFRFGTSFRPVGLAESCDTAKLIKAVSIFWRIRGKPALEIRFD